MKRSLKTAGAACLAAGLVSTWDTQVEAQVPWYPGSTPGPAYSFSGEISPTQNLYDAYFIFACGPCNPPYAALISDYIAAGTTLSFNVTINTWDTPSGAPSVGNHFAIAAVYDPTTSGVTLGMDPTQAANPISQGASFSGGVWSDGYSAYQPPNPAYPPGVLPRSTDESTVAATLESGSYLGQPLDDSDYGGIGIDPNTYLFQLPTTPGGAATETYYYPTISTDPNNPSDFSLVDFSNATAAGSGYAIEVVPEPTTISLLALGLLSCGWLRRRKAD